VPTRFKPRQILGHALRDFRERLGLSQEALGDAAGLHRTYVGSVERGERNPSFESLDKILTALETSWAEFGATIDAHMVREKRSAAARK
jgi:transcriptional regulator with XRE-family HTH domain